MKIVKPEVTLEWITPNAAAKVERAGRTCYKSEEKCGPGTAARFIEARLTEENPHESVIEHAVASFRIICDRGISHELVRHRIASFSQESTRYCNYAGKRFGGEIKVVCPSGMTPQQFAIWKDAMAMAEIFYFKLLEAGAKPQTARSVLPTCTKTELVMTANLREWRHFLALRMAPGAHPDMRILAQVIANILCHKAPEFFPEDVFWERDAL